MSIEGLEEKVIKWAYDREIFLHSTEHTRLNKFQEECCELAHAVEFEGIDEMKLEAGDVLVTLINLLHPLNLDLETCLQAAYDKIKDRKGQMVDGTFQREK